MIALLTAADTEILTLSRAVQRLPAGFGPVRAVHVADLKDAQAVEAWLEKHAAAARVLVMRLLGGRRSFEHGFDRVVAFCRSRRTELVALPGHQEIDLEVMAASTVDERLLREVFAYFSHGGVRNFASMLRCLSDRLLNTAYGYAPPQPLPWEGVYHPGEPDDTALSPEELIRRRHRPGRPSVGLLFYRAHWMSGNLAFVDALVQELEALGANTLPVFCYSLKGDTPRALTHLLADGEGRPRVDILISTLSFSLHDGSDVPGEPDPDSPFGALTRLGVPVLQAVVSLAGRQEWEASLRGLGPLDVAMNVALPELDGRVITAPVSFKEEEPGPSPVGAAVRRYVAHPDRVAFVARLALRWAQLGRKPNAEKRVAILLTNYPSRNARIGNAVGLDTPASAVRLLEALRRAGYRVDPIPTSGDELIRHLVAAGTFDPEFGEPAGPPPAPALRLPAERYRQWWATANPRAREQIARQWGPPPDGGAGPQGEPGADLPIPGLVLGNVFVGIQPPRGYGDDPVAIYHSPDLVPTHQYLAYYRWIRDEFGADAVVHLGKHGTLEWLPGKGIGLSAACFPEVVLGELPHFYPYIVNNPGEGSQAKRRAHAVILDHLVPAMTTADTYEELAELERLLDEYYQAEVLNPPRLPILQRQIWELVQRTRLDRDLGTDGPPGAEGFSAFVDRVDGYLCELAEAQIRDGLHVLGQAPQGSQLIGLLQAMLRLPNGNLPSLRGALARALHVDLEALLREQGRRYTGQLPVGLAHLEGEAPVHVAGDVVRRLDRLGARLLEEMAREGWRPEAAPGVVGRILGQQGPGALREAGQAGGRQAGDGAARGVEAVLRFAAAELVPRLQRTGQEIDHLLLGLEGRLVPPGPSGSPTRGQFTVLPTGRNFYSLDPQVVPTRAAWEVGVQLARGVLDRYRRDEGRYPETVGIVVWGTSTMRTQGDDIAEILHLLGVRPVWRAQDGRVRGLEVIPLEELGRPRIDVVVRISGFFRDAFANLIALMDEAVATVAALEEPPQLNFVRKHLLEELGSLQPLAGTPAAAGRAGGPGPAVEAAAADTDGEERRQALYRVFGSKPGAYGAGILPAIHEGNWQDLDDLARIYITWGSYAYTRTQHGVRAEQAFKRRFAQIGVAVKNQDNREHDLFDSDDYLQYHGGMIATIRSLTGRPPRQYFGDSSDPGRAQVRDLADEARRVLRTRVVNPKWLAAIRRHGYKGASELAATVEYLFGYDATAEVVEDWMYEQVAARYALDPEMQAFFREKNPWALRDIASRLLEAARRGMWEAPPPQTLEALRRVYLEFEGEIEGGLEP